MKTIADLELALTEFDRLTAGLPSGASAEELAKAVPFEMLAAMIELMPTAEELRESALGKDEREILADFRRAMIRRLGH